MSKTSDFLSMLGLVGFGLLFVALLILGIAFEVGKVIALWKYIFS